MKETQVKKMKRYSNWINQHSSNLDASKSKDWMNYERNLWKNLKKKKNYHQRFRRDWEENWEAKGRAKQWDLGIRGVDAKRFG